MKTQRRHELQTNSLADHVGRWLLQVEPYSKHILFGVVAVVAIGLAWMYLSSQQQARSAAGWNDYFAAFAEHDPEALDEVVALHGEGDAALWALVTAGDVKLARGTIQLYIDRDEAVKLLEGAEKHFLEVEKRAGGQALLLRRSQYGLGQVYESLSDVKKARQYYETVAKAEPDSAWGMASKQRFDVLSRKTTEDFYAWFEKAKPPVRDPSTGQAIDPNAIDPLPERPDLSFPGSEVSAALTAPSNDVGPTLGPATDPVKPSTEPATDPVKPTDKPAEPADKPAEPATKPTDATEKPAEPAVKPAEPAVKPAEPAEKPAEPANPPSKTSDTPPEAPSTSPEAPAKPSPTPGEKPE